MTAKQQLAGVIENVQMPSKSPAIVVMSPTSSQGKKIFGLNKHLG